MNGNVFELEEAQRIDEEMEVEFQAQADCEAEAAGETGSRKRSRPCESADESAAEHAFDDVEADAIENVQVTTLQNNELPFVDGLNAFADDEGSQREYSIASGNQEAEEFEEEDNDNIASVPLERWQLGDGFVPIPPSDSRSAVSSDWAPWTADKQGKLRAVRHMIMQRTLETRDLDQNMFSFKGYSDASMNERVIALAAIEGLMFDSEVCDALLDQKAPSLLHTPN